MLSALDLFIVRVYSVEIPSIYCTRTSYDDYSYTHVYVAILIVLVYWYAPYEYQVHRAWAVRQEA